MVFSLVGSGFPRNTADGGKSRAAKPSPGHSEAKVQKKIDLPCMPAHFCLYINIVSSHAFFHATGHSCPLDSSTYRDGEEKEAFHGKPSRQARLHKERAAFPEKGKGGQQVFQQALAVGRNISRKATGRTDSRSIHQQLIHVPTAVSRLDFHQHHALRRSGHGQVQAGFVPETSAL